MTFAAPWVLAGLVFAAVPVLLHLLARREPPTVVFPATRYLAQAARQHQRRLQLQHLLLLLVRTLAIVAIVLAAAGPTWPAGSVGAHAPTALVVVVDNSLSSGAVRAGEPVLDALKRAARDVFDRATPDDRLWLVTSDGIARPGSAADLRRAVDELAPDARRLDLGAALDLARQVLASVPDLPGEAMLVTDLQASALGAGDPPAALGVLYPEEPPIANAGIIRLPVGVQPWPAEGGVVGVQVAGSGGGSRAVSVGFSGRPPRQLLVPPGGQGSVRLPAPGPGWWLLEAALDPDELRADDRRLAGVRVAPPARVTWDPGDRYLATAAQVLEKNGRIRQSAGVTLGSLGAGPSIVLPPADAARIGALNRALAARGSQWRFGDLQLAATATDSGPWLGRERVARRYALEFAGGAARDVLITAGGQPWLVRSDSILLLASRLEPDWTSAPLSAAFVPFVDALVNRATRGELVGLEAAPGDRAALPDRVSEVVLGEQHWSVEGGAGFRPSELGVYFLVADRDTVGTLAVNPDPRESDLTPASRDAVRSLWPGARLASLDEAGDVAFAAGARSDLRGPLLWLVAGLLLAEVALASLRRSRT